jgi:energy-coupling factor transporter transmembrane protein EcfT
MPGPRAYHHHHHIIFIIFIIFIIIIIFIFIIIIIFTIILIFFIIIIIFMDLLQNWCLGAGQVRLGSKIDWNLVKLVLYGMSLGVVQMIPGCSRGEISRTN